MSRTGTVSIIAKSSSTLRAQHSSTGARLGAGPIEHWGHPLVAFIRNGLRPSGTLAA
jgi:hypothetical protein